MRPRKFRDARTHVFRHSDQDRSVARALPDSTQTLSPTYRLAFDDPEFLLRDELRPVRLQLELMKPELVMNEAGINSTVVLFGGARIPAPEHADTAKTPMLAELSRYYTQARRFARLVTELSLESGGHEMVVCTGGGPGVMEAGNRGAAEAGGRSVGLNIVLPHEQEPNPFVTPGLSFNFHYFAVRKMHFLMRAEALAVFPGGFGTLDETFEALTLIQTRRMRRIPVVMFGRDFWERVVNWELLAEAGTIARKDLELFRFVETAEDAMAVLTNWSSEAGA